MKCNNCDIKPRKLTRYERETTITFNEGEDECAVYSCMKRWQNHLENKLGVKPERIEGEGRFYQIPKRWIPLPRKPRQLSEDEKVRRTNIIKKRPEE